MGGARAMRAVPPQCKMVAPTVFSLCRPMGASERAVESTGAAVAACISGRSDEGAAFVGNRQQDSRGSARLLSVVSILAILVVGLLHAQRVGEREATEAPWVLGAWRAMGDQACGDTAFTSAHNTTIVTWSACPANVSGELALGTCMSSGSERAAESAFSAAWLRAVPCANAWTPEVARVVDEWEVMTSRVVACVMDFVARASEICRGVVLAMSREALWSCGARPGQCAVDVVSEIGWSAR